MFSSKYKLENGSFAFDIKAKPADWNTNDLSFEAKNATSYKTEGAKWENTTGIKAGLPPMGPVRLWATLDFVFKMGGSRLLKNSFNAQILDHFFLGSKIEHDTAALKAAQFVLAHKEGSKLSFAKWDNFSKVVTLGHSCSCPCKR